MKVIDLQSQPVTLEDLIELARQDPVSIVTPNGEEVYVAHLGAGGSILTQAETGARRRQGMSPEELEAAIEEELERIEAGWLARRG